MIRTAALNVKKWYSDPVIYIVLGLIILFAYYDLGAFRSFAAEYGEKVSAWGASVYFTPLNMVILYIALLGLLFCNAPFYDSSSQFSVIRVGRFNWISGQIIYIAFTAFVLVAVAWLATWAVWLPRISFSNDWGRVIKTAAANGMLSSEHLIYVYFPAKVMEFDPIKTAAMSFFMSWLTSFFAGTLFMFFNFFCGKTVSFSVFGLLWFLSSVPDFLMYFNWGSAGCYLSLFSYMNVFYTREYGEFLTNPPLWYCITVLSVCAAVFSVSTVIGFCRRDLDAGREE